MRFQRTAEFGFHHIQQLVAGRGIKQRLNQCHHFGLGDFSLQIKAAAQHRGMLGVVRIKFLLNAELRQPVLVPREVLAFVGHAIDRVGRGIPLLLGISFPNARGDSTFNRAAHHKCQRTLHRQSFRTIAVASAQFFSHQPVPQQLAIGLEGGFAIDSDHAAHRNVLFADPLARGMANVTRTLGQLGGNAGPERLAQSRISPLVAAPAPSFSEHGRQVWVIKMQSAQEAKLLLPQLLGEVGRRVKLGEQIIALGQIIASGVGPLAQDPPGFVQVTVNLFERGFKPISQPVTILGGHPVVFAERRHGLFVTVRVGPSFRHAGDTRANFFGVRLRMFGQNSGHGGIDRTHCQSCGVFKQKSAQRAQVRHQVTHFKRSQQRLHFRHR